LVLHRQRGGEASARTFVPDVPLNEAKNHLYLQQGSEVVVEASLCSNILDRIAAAGEFESRPGSGLAIQLAIEDAVGLSSQIRELSKKIEEEI
jgi:hypothetical protein